MIFDPVTHQYKLNGHTFKYSVTGLAGKYVPPFPAGMIAEKVAKKEGTTTEEVLRKWDINKDMACDYGNAVDKAIQLWVDFKEEPKNEHLREIVQKFAQDHAGDLVTQISVYNEEKSVCGTTDVIRKLGNKEIDIIDVKSNADFYKKGTGKLLTPFDDLPNDNLNKYRLQLSIYKDLFEMKGITVKSISIWHPDEGIIKLEPLNLEKVWQTI
jgi:hypothetical protein